MSDAGDTAGDTNDIKLILDAISEEERKEKEREREVQQTFEQGEQPKAPKPDPAIVAYVEHKWYQLLGPMRTACFRCGIDSPVIYSPPGVTAFGGPIGRGEVDNTGAVQREFSKLGWRFEMRRSYCPTCKGLGSTA